MVGVGAFRADAPDPQPLQAVRLTGDGLPDAPHPPLAPAGGDDSQVMGLPYATHPPPAPAGGDDSQVTGLPTRLLGEARPSMSANSRGGKAGRALGNKHAGLASRLGAKHPP